MFSALLRLVGLLIALALLVLLGIGAWTGYRVFYAKDEALRAKDAELAQERNRSARLLADNKAKAREIDRLQTALRLLKVDHRIAYLDVVDQRRKPDGDRLETRIDFVEVDDAGKAIDAPRRFTLEGDMVYVDYWVIKFDDALIERNDPLRSTSLALFQRLFGEFQEPNDGFTLDRPGRRPAAYGAGELSTFERELWDHFWQYATDPEKAKAAGVRAAHGEAVSTRLLPNKRYRIQLRASDGLTITPQEKPPTENRPAA
jgi:hypothetical protein